MYSRRLQVLPDETFTAGGNKDTQRREKEAQAQLDEARVSPYVQVIAEPLACIGQ